MGGAVQCARPMAGAPGTGRAGHPDPRRGAAGARDRPRAMRGAARRTAPQAVLCRGPWVMGGAAQCTRPVAGAPGTGHGPRAVRAHQPPGTGLGPHTARHGAPLPQAVTRGQGGAAHPSASHTSGTGTGHALNKGVATGSPDPVAEDHPGKLVATPSTGLNHPWPDPAPRASSDPPWTPLGPPLAPLRMIKLPVIYW